MVAPLFAAGGAPCRPVRFRRRRAANGRNGCRRVPARSGPSPRDGSANAGARLLTGTLLLVPLLPRKPRPKQAPPPKKLSPRPTGSPADVPAALPARGRGGGEGDDAGRDFSEKTAGWQGMRAVAGCVPASGKGTAGVNPPPPAFADLLRVTGLNQTQFRELVGRLTGRSLDRTTTSRWVRGTRPAPPCALALLELIARIPPGELRRLLAQ
jgi:hypothetical protein